MRLTIFLLGVILIFNSQAQALSCNQAPGTECSEITDVRERNTCLARVVLEVSDRIVKNRMKANSCMLSNKMKRREYLQAQCKTKVVSLNRGCSVSDNCLPNGIEGQMVQAYSGQFVTEADFNDPNFNTWPWGESGIHKCINGEWVQSNSLVGFRN